ncbi:substrate-binding periplasmic protein [Saccharospirillum impatiens]|uniref:substrate-binding periplasmic protein n=1 Tax=Saccharospirillum impatiens TaxID=169438 RepID=UPI0003FD075C|nr:amino acid ABC transporter substrate-binding protein [Saccharospirillum impatiens]
MARILVVLWIVTSVACVRAELSVVYPASESALDRRFDDLTLILRTALEKTRPDFGDFEMRSASAPMTSMRYSQELMAGRTPNVIWTSTSVERETLLRPIRIPLRKGLLSYRVALTRAESQPEIDKVKTVEDLATLTLAQGIGWGDILVFEANGLTVSTSEYESLFRMIDAGRVDLFPRGIGEVFEEWTVRREVLPNLTIEPNLLLFYPWPYYFFVQKDNVALAERLETGLLRMVEDGSFDAIFWHYHGEAIERARLPERRVIELTNPLLPPETPLDDARLWYQPS